MQNTKHKTQNLKTQNPTPEVKNPKPSTRCPQPKIPNSKPNTQHQKPETREQHGTRQKWSLHVCLGQLLSGLWLCLSWVDRLFLDMLGHWYESVNFGAKQAILRQHKSSVSPKLASPLANITGAFSPGICTNHETHLPGRSMAHQEKLVVTPMIESGLVGST